MRSYYYLRIIRICFYLLLFVPLFVWGRFYFPFVFPKTALFLVLVEIAALAYVFLIISYPEYRPKISYIGQALLVFLVVVFIASFFGIDFYRSFWSSYERMTGIVTLVHLFAFFIILTSVFKNEKDWIFLFDLTVLASLLQSFLAFVQKLGFNWIVGVGEGRVSGTIGNPSFLAAYILFHLFIILFLFLNKYTSIGWRLYYSFVFIFEFLIFYWTSTRGAFLAFFAALFLFGILFIFASYDKLSSIKNIRKFKKYIASLLILLIILSFLIYLFRNSVFIQKTGTIKRLVSISLKDTTTQTRLLAWEMSFNGWKEKFWLGYGWENYNYVFNKFYDPKLYPTENWFDRAHNIVFDIATTTGIFGLLAYLAIFVFCFFVLWKNFKNNKINYPIFLIFVALLFAYFIQNFFVFDMINSYLVFFLILAFIEFLNMKKEEVSIYSKPKKLKPQKLIIKKPNPIIYPLFFITFCFVFFFVNLKPAMAGWKLINAYADKEKNLDKSFENFEKALELKTFGRFEIREKLGDFTLNLLSNSDIPKDKVEKFYNFASDELEKSTKERSRDIHYKLMLATIYKKYSSFNEEKLKLAETELEESLKLSPSKPPIYHLLAQIKFMENKKEEAIDLLKRAVDLNPQAPDSQWNLCVIAAKFNLAGEALGACQSAIRLSPLNAHYLAQYAILLANVGRKEEAIKNMEKAVEINPDFSTEGKKFIDDLNKK